MIRDSSGMSLPREPAGVAAAVEALVVMEHPVRLIGSSAASRIAWPMSTCRVIARRSSAASALGLLQDRVGDADLADVVQQAREAQPLEAGRRSKPSRSPIATQSCGDRLGVAARAGVLGVDGARERRCERRCSCDGPGRRGAVGRGPEPRVSRRRRSARALRLVEREVGLVHEQRGGPRVPIDSVRPMRHARRPSSPRVAWSIRPASMSAVPVALGRAGAP